MFNRMTFNAMALALTPPASEPPCPLESPATNYPCGGAPDTSNSNTDQNTQVIRANPPSHATGRPWGDNRSADEIVKGDPRLQDFYHRAYPKGYLEELYKKVGDFSINNPDPKARADAMYNLSQVIGYITSGTDSRALEIPGQSIFAGGKTYRPESRSNSQLFDDFRENGYPALIDPRTDSEKYKKNEVTEHNTETKTSTAPQVTENTAPPKTTTPVISSTKAERSELNTDVAPTGPTGRPEGDERSADQILKENHRIVNSRPNTISDEELIAVVGDFTPNNPDPRSRADAAYNLVRLLHYIDSITTEVRVRTNMATYNDEDAERNTTPYKYKNNGEIDGQYKSPLLPPFDESSIEKGSEAAIYHRVVKEKSYSALPADKSEYSKKTEEAYPKQVGLTRFENNYMVPA